MKTQELSHDLACPATDTERKYVFVCGMPRSGTTILAKEIARFANCTGFENTGVMMDEGQYLQDVYPTEWACGGAGRFGFDPQAHLTENSPLLTPANVARLRQSWEPYWDESRTIRVEKTPGNLLKTRFLQDAFSNAYFVVVKRHPVAVSLAVQKWSLTPLHELFEHWLRCHEVFDEDKKRLERLYELSYEDYVENPGKHLEEIANFIGTEPPGPLSKLAAEGYNQKYFERWARMLQSSPFRSYYRSVAREYEPRFAGHGYSLTAPSCRVELSPRKGKPVLAPLLRRCAGAFFALWRAGRSFRIRIEHGAAFSPVVSVPKKTDAPGQFTARLRILLLGPDCNPEEVSIPLVTYSHAAALAQLHDVTLVARSTVEDALRRAKAPFRAIEVVRLPWLERIYAWSFRWIFRNDFTSQALTAFGYPFSLAFEWRAWRQLRRRIYAGEFDVAMRIVPTTAVLPSPLAFFLRKGLIPFVIGPINGGLPFVQGFSQTNNEKQWISGLRNLYRFLPFARSTYRNAAAIIAASSHTYAEFAAYRDKLFFIPENAVGRSLCLGDLRSPEPGAKLGLIFVGGLIPCKACDLALRAAAPLLRSNVARFTVVGDGPERNRLEELARSLEIEKAVSFCGWLSHAEVLRRLRSADVLVFPSVRDFGGGVVFEALAAGAVPVVVDFGGPGDIVHPAVGYKVPATNEDDVVSQMEKILSDLAGNRDLLGSLRQQGMSYARECLTWDAKAQSTTRVLNWAVRRGPKPDLPPPKMLHLQCAS